MKITAIRPVYVDQLPDDLEEGVLYICEEFSLTAHKCCCGCGEDVYNKLSPVKWQLVKLADGCISLSPSIGNWKYACRSHYWIERNQVIDAGPMSRDSIAAVQARDARDRDAHFAHLNAQADTDQDVGTWRRLVARVARFLRRLRSLWPW